MGGFNKCSLDPSQPTKSHLQKAVRWVCIHSLQVKPLALASNHKAFKATIVLNTRFALTNNIILISIDAKYIKYYQVLLIKLQLWNLGHLSIDTFVVSLKKVNEQALKRDVSMNSAGKYCYPK